MRALAGRDEGRDPAGGAGPSGDAAQRALADRVLWHDIECGAYRADLSLWLALAADVRGPVLDVGAGAGRVALELARAGHHVVALDEDPELLAALRERAALVGAAGGTRRAVETVLADARAFDLERRFELIVVPMQTIQLLGGAPGRAAFLRRARRHLAPGGLLAVALADAFDGVERDARYAPPDADVLRRDGWVYSSRPLSVRAIEGAVAIERRRQVAGPAGELEVALDVICLDDVDAAALAHEAQAAGLRAEPALSVPATEEHVGSEVAMLRA